jgi:hypothetical protein
VILGEALCFNGIMRRKYIETKDSEETFQVSIGLQKNPTDFYI